MGNQPPNYNLSYHTWLKYRNTLRPQSQTIPNSNHKTNQLIPPFNRPVSVVDQNKNSSNTNSEKQINKVILKHEQLKKNIPAVIAGNKIAPVSHLFQRKQQNKHETKIINSQQPALNLQDVRGVSSHSTTGAQPPILLPNGGNSKEKKIMFASKIDIIDEFKAEVKETRKRIDLMANEQQKQYVWILSQIKNQKIRLIPDKNKLIFLLKESKDYEKLIIGLRTKRQTIVGVLNDLNQHKYNSDMRNTVYEINEYIDSVQKEFIKIDWRAIIMEAATNMQRYIDIYNLGVSDPDVQKHLKQIQREVEAMKQQSVVSQSSTPQQQNTTVISAVDKTTIKQTEQDKKIQKTCRQSMQVSISPISNMVIVNQSQQLPMKSSNLENSQKRSHIRTSSATNSRIGEPEGFQGYGLIVTTPSLIRTIPIYDPKAHNQQSKGIMQANFKKSTRQSNLGQNRNGLFKNLQMNGEEQSSQVRSIRPEINQMQSNIKYSSPHEVYSAKKVLLK